MINTIDYQQVFSEIASELKSLEDLGEVAKYIPELAKVDPENFGIHLTSTQSKTLSYGNAHDKFSIQSISKVLSLTLALKILGEDLWKRVGVEPSGSPFNSLVQLEYEKGIPRNPFINAGAIVVCDILVSHLNNPKVEISIF